MVVCREGTEGPYAGAGGTLRPGTPQEVATEESLNTAYGVERIVRDAFARATRRRPRHRAVTLVHKTNVLVHAGGLWLRMFEAVAAEFPDIATDYCHVDAASMFLLTDPERFDVVVTDNLFGDIITDIGAAIAGGIGLAASGNLDPEPGPPEHVRAGARLRARHRRSGHRRPHRDGAVRRDAARPPGRGEGGPRGRGRGRGRPGRRAPRSAPAARPRSATRWRSE